MHGNTSGNLYAAGVLRRTGCPATGGCMRKQTVPILIVATFAWTQMAAFTWASPQATSTTKKTTSSTAHPTSPTNSSSASLLKPASLKLQAPAVYDAKFITTKGDFVVEV